MTSPIPKFTLTNDTVTVIWEGKPFTARKPSPQFSGLRTAILNEAWGDIKKNLTVPKALKSWAKGKFGLDGEGDSAKFTYKGEPVNASVNHRIITMATHGEDPQPLLNFWEKLLKNPSHRSVQQLFTFLQHVGIPLATDGCFLAYKSVDRDYMDHYSHTVDNHPGKTITFDRNKVSDDPNTACHEGLHVGALEYASSFGDDSRRIIICKVDPADVVCVPYDESQRKMRVCRYEVVGLHTGQHLPSTSIADTEIPAYEDEDEDDICSGCAEHIDECQCGDEDPADAAEAGEYEEKINAAQDGFSPHDPPAPTRKTKTNPVPQGSTSIEALSQHTIADLRVYAREHLKLVGVGHLLGGKPALVKLIIETTQKGGPTA